MTRDAQATGPDARKIKGSGAKALKEAPEEAPRRRSAAAVDLASENVQEYLEAVYSFNEAGAPAKTSQLAAMLGVKPSSVTGMMQKLSRAGLVRYRKYKGATLTEEGLRLGRRMKRKHRILERFLSDVLCIRTDKVHEQACAMEHSLSDEAEQAMCKVLGGPQVCPDDGKPIPPCGPKEDGKRDCRDHALAVGEAEVAGGGGERGPRPLTELGSGGKAVIAFIRGGPGVMKRLSDMGLTPEATIHVEKVAPFKGPVQVRVRGSSLVIGRGIASRIFVMAP